MENNSSSKQNELKAEQVSILVADVKDYSELDEYELRRFFNETLEKISEDLERNNAREMNSWGDGIIAYFNDPKSAAKCALEIRDTFRNTSWSSIGLPDLAIRIALHTATVFVGRNYIRGREGIVGTDVNLAARIEPIVTPNHVFTTKIFKDNLEPQIKEDDSIAFDELYETELAKGWGKENLYNLRRLQETEISPDQVVEPSVSEKDGSKSHVDALKETFLQNKSIDADQQKRAVDILAEGGEVDAIPALTEALVDKETVRADVRARIAMRLANFNDDRVLDPLIEAVKDGTNKAVVNNAVATLGELENIKAFEVLEEVLKDKENYSDKVRRTAALSLSDLDDDRSISVLAEILNDEEDSEKVRRGVAVALSNLEDSKSVDTFINALDAPEENVRGVAIEALGELGDKKAIDPIKNLLDKPKETKKDIRIAATNALVDIGEPEVVEPLTSAFEDPSKEVQAAAIRSLGELGAVEALDALEQRLNSENEAPKIIRVSTAYSIGEIGDPKSVDVLIDTMKNDESLEVRKAAIGALAEIKPIDAIGELVEIVEDNENTIADIRDAAALALGKMGYFDALDGVVEAIDDPVVEVQRSAIEAAAEIGGEKAIQKLTEVISDDEKYPGAVRAMAATHIRHFEDPRVVSALIDILKDDTNPRVKRISCIALGKIGDSQATGILAETLTDESSDLKVRYAAAWSMGVISDPASEESITDIAQGEEEPWRIQRVAIHALGSLGTTSSRNQLEQIAETGDYGTEAMITAREVLSRSPHENRKILKNELDEGDW